MPLAACDGRSLSRPVMATREPAPASDLAIARPMPLEPPVINAVAPLRFILVALSDGSHQLSLAHSSPIGRIVNGNNPVDIEFQTIDVHHQIFGVRTHRIRGRRIHLGGVEGIRLYEDFL